MICIRLLVSGKCSVLVGKYLVLPGPGVCRVPTDAAPPAQPAPLDLETAAVPLKYISIQSTNVPLLYIVLILPATTVLLVHITNTAHHGYPDYHIPHNSTPEVN